MKKIGSIALTLLQDGAKLFAVYLIFRTLAGTLDWAIGKVATSKSYVNTYNKMKAKLAKATPEEAAAQAQADAPAPVEGEYLHVTA